MQHCHYSQHFWIKPYYPAHALRCRTMGAVNTKAPKPMEGAVNTKAPKPMEADLTSEESPASIAQRLEELSTVDRVAHYLLVHPEMIGAVNEKQMRRMLRYQPGIRDLGNLSKHIHDAVVMLIKD